MRARRPASIWVDRIRSRTGRRRRTSRSTRRRRSTQTCAAVCSVNPCLPPCRPSSSSSRCRPRSRWASSISPQRNCGPSRPRSPERLDSLLSKGDDVPPIDPSTVDGLTVRYVLDVGADRIDEADSMLQFDDYAASIRSARYCEGAVILAAEGQESLALNDALPFLVKELCFRSMRPLSDGKSVTVPFFMTGVDVVASVHGGQIELSLTLGGSFHFEKRSMMNALFQCGR